MNAALVLALLQAAAPEARAAEGMDAFSWTFMLVSMGSVSALTFWCFWRILRGRSHFDPDGTGPAHAPVQGEAEKGRAR